MSDFEAVITSAIANEEIPGCVLVACNRDGSFKYGKSFGNTSIKAENAKPLALDTVMWVASCTKLMTSISAMQLVERGLVTLDEPVYKYIPELESFTVIKSFDEDGKPIEEKHTKPITLRLLLSHSSGLVYDAIHPKTMAWVAYHKKQRTVGSGKLLERFSAPLVHEPGEGWSYGPSIDYAGLLIERITGKTLQEYMKENIWTPLGITDTTFFLEKRPDMKNRMAGMTLRSEDGKLKPSEGNEAYQDVDGKEMQECMGGHGSFTTAEEYLKVLQGVLTSDENERLLKKETVELFFSPQLGEASSKALNAVLQDDMFNNAMGGTSKDIIKDWGLGGLLITSDSPDGKKKNTMIWGGLPNLRWWVDRTAGLCGLYAGQLLPPGDAKISELTTKFEAGIYTQYAQAQRDSTSRL